MSNIKSKINIKKKSESEVKLNKKKSISDKKNNLKPKTNLKKTNSKKPNLKKNTKKKSLNNSKTKKVVKKQESEEDDDIVISVYSGINKIKGKDEYNKKKINSDIIAINNFPNSLLVSADDININDNSFINKEPEKISTIMMSDDNGSIKFTEDDLMDVIELASGKVEQNKNILVEEKKIEISPINECKCCGTKGSLIEDRYSSSVVCDECGTVNEESVDQGPEWRQYNNDDSRGESIARCGCPTNYYFPSSSQGTTIAGYGNSRLRKKLSQNQGLYKERILSKVFEMITKICYVYKIPKVAADDAKIYYNALYNCKHKKGESIGKQIIVRGNNRMGIIAACVKKACQKNCCSRSNKEIAKMFDIEPSKVTSGCKQFCKIIEQTENRIILDVINNTLNDDNPPEYYVRILCSKLRMYPDDVELAITISKNCTKLKIATEQSNKSIAAASILIVSEANILRIDRKKLSDLYGGEPTQVTISKTYKKIYKYANALVDDVAADIIYRKYIMVNEPTD